MNDIFVIVIPEPSAQFFIIHLGFILALAPPLGHLVWIDQFELPTIARPADEGLARLFSEELEKELPQLDWPTSGQN